MAPTAPEPSAPNGRENLQTLLGQFVVEPVFALSLLAGFTILLAWLWTGRPRIVDTAEKTLARALLALLVAQSTQVLLVLKYPYQPKYLLPSLMLSGLSLAIAGLLLRTLMPRRPRWSLFATAVLGLAILGIHSQCTLTAQLRERSDAGRLAIAAVNSQPNVHVVDTYGASSPEYALFWGNIWSGSRWSTQLAALSPHALFYELGANHFSSFDQPCVPQVPGPVLIHGAQDARGWFPPWNLHGILWGTREEVTRLDTPANQPPLTFGIPDTGEPATLAPRNTRLVGPSTHPGLRYVFDSDGTETQLAATFRRSLVTDQMLRIRLNGQPIFSRRAKPTPLGLESVHLTLYPRPGPNELTFDSIDIATSPPPEVRGIIMRDLRLGPHIETPPGAAPPAPGNTRVFLGLLPAACFILLTLVIYFRWPARRGNPAGWREALIAAAMMLTVWTVAGTELLSLFHAIQFWPIFAWWALPTVALALMLRSAWGRRDIRLPRLTGTAEWTMAILLAALLGAAGLAAALTPPNTYDALTYHLPPQIMWLQDHTIHHFPARNVRQLMMPPLAEFMGLQLFALSGGDLFHGFIEFSRSRAQLPPPSPSSPATPAPPGPANCSPPYLS